MHSELFLVFAYLSKRKVLFFLLRIASVKIRIYYPFLSYFYFLAALQNRHILIRNGTLQVWQHSSTHIPGICGQSSKVAAQLFLVNLLSLYIDLIYLPF